MLGVGPNQAIQAIFNQATQANPLIIGIYFRLLNNFSLEAQGDFCVHGNWLVYTTKS